MLASNALRPVLVGAWLRLAPDLGGFGDLEPGRSPEFGGIDSPRIWGPVWVPGRVWQARARGHDLAGPPGALPDLFLCRGPGFGTRRRTRSPGRGGAGEGLGAVFTRGPGPGLSLLSSGVTEEKN